MQYENILYNNSNDGYFILLILIFFLISLVKVYKVWLWLNPECRVIFDRVSKSRSKRRNYVLVLLNGGSKTYYCKMFIQVYKIILILILFCGLLYHNRLKLTLFLSHIVMVHACWLLVEERDLKINKQHRGKSKSRRWGKSKGLKYSCHIVIHEVPELKRNLATRSGTKLFRCPPSSHRNHRSPSRARRGQPTTTTVGKTKTPGGRRTTTGPPRHVTRSWRKARHLNGAASTGCNTFNATHGPAPNAAVTPSCAIPVEPKKNKVFGLATAIPLISPYLCGHTGDPPRRRTESGTV
jgi:hypothetical protein